MTAVKFGKLGLVAALFAALFAVSCGSAGGRDEYPNRQIDFIVPLAAGSAPDTTFRTLSEIAEQELGQSIVIVNKPGGGGTVGTTDIINANPEGYTIGMSAVAILTLRPELQEAAYEGPEDLQPIIQTNAAPVVLFVRADSGIETIDDFVQRAREEPGTLIVGIPDPYSILDLEVDLLQRDAGIEVNKVAYGAGKQVPAVVNGTADAAVAQPAAMLQYVERGDLRILGVFGEQELEGLDAPLFTEAGYDITEIPYEFIVAPKDIPADRAQIIHDAYKTAMESQEFQDYVDQQKVLGAYVGTEELQQKLERDDGAHEEYIQQLGWAGTQSATTQTPWRNPALLVGASLLAILAVVGVFYRIRYARKLDVSAARGDAQLGEESQEGSAAESVWEPSPLVRLLLLAIPTVVGVSYLIEALRLPLGSLEAPNFGFFPMLVGVLLVGAAAITLFRQGASVLRRGATGGKEADTGDAEVDPGDTASFQPKLLIIMAAVLVYVLFAGVVGHIVTATFVSAVALRATGERPWWQVLLLAIATGVGTYLLFVVALGMPLPTGSLFSLDL
jgi:tripartite-type tricarboxylate transporter receptor subunit TctC